MVTFLTIVSMVKYKTIVCERLNMVIYITIVSMVNYKTIVFEVKYGKIYNNSLYG